MMTKLPRWGGWAAAWAAIVLAGGAEGASLAPLASFGGGDGWRAPFEVVTGDAAGTDSISPGLYNYLGNAFNNTSVNAGNLERGLAYNPSTGHLILVSRNNQTNTLPSIRILNGTTGADIGSLSLGGGFVTGGSFPYNMVGVADDGAIYVANLSLNTATTGTNAAPYKIYRWANESAEPTLAYSGQPDTLLSGARLGDSFDVIGAGVNTRLIAGYAAAPAVAGNNGVALFTTSNGTSFSATNIAMAANLPLAVPAAGEFRLGLTFTDSDSFMGKSAVNPVVAADISGTTATVTANFSTAGIDLKPMDFAIIQGKPILAVVEASASQAEAARARLFVYDMTDPSVPIIERQIAVGTNLSPFTPGGPNQFVNGNATGQVKFGPINGNVATIYAMSTNNGIEAFTLTLDPPPDADFNDDTIVGAADLAIWTGSFGMDSGVTNTTGDANSDSAANGADFLIWQRQYSEGVAFAAVPEPGSGILLAAALVGWASGARRSSRRLIDKGRG